MFALLSLVVCLASQPVLCQTVVPAYVRADTGASLTYFECLGASGQDVARRWLSEHPGHRLHKIRCSIANDPERLRAQIEEIGA